MLVDLRFCRNGDEAEPAAPFELADHQGPLPAPRLTVEPGVDCNLKPDVVSVAGTDEPAPILAHEVGGQPAGHESFGDERSHIAAVEPVPGVVVLRELRGLVEPIGLEPEPLLELAAGHVCNLCQAAPAPGPRG
jgi:hypothetical protein